MRKIIFLLVAMVFTFPAAADWKAEVIDEVMEMSRTVVSAIDDEVPEGETIDKYSLYNSVVGLCIGVVGSTQQAIPSVTADNSARMLKIFMLGGQPANTDIRQLGIDCLAYMEDYLITQGATQEEIETLLLPEMKTYFQNFSSRFSNFPDKK